MREVALLLLWIVFSSLLGGAERVTVFSRDTEEIKLLLTSM